MNTFNQKLGNFAAALILSCAAAAPVHAFDVTASGSGWITESGAANNSGFSGGISNNFTGWEGELFNNWFTFALPNTVITSATLNIWNDSNNSTIDPAALYTLHQASSFTHAGLASGGAANQN